MKGGVHLTTALNRARLRYGRELLREYPQWVQIRKTLDDWIEGIVSSPGPSEAGKVMGPLPVPQQELLIERKESDPYYQTLCRNIERVERIVSGLSDDKRFLVEFFHWKGREWWELCKALGCSQTTLYRWIDEIDEAVAEEWE